MSEVVAVALVTGSVTGVTAITAALAQIFGPSWAAKREREALRTVAQEDGRFDRVTTFLEALLAINTMSEPWDQRCQVEMARKARQRFVATLRRGEAPAVSFTTSLLESVVDAQDSDIRTVLIYQGGDRLYAWLRGDLSARELDRHRHGLVGPHGG